MGLFSGARSESFRRLSDIRMCRSCPEPKHTRWDWDRLDRIRHVIMRLPRT